MNTIKIILFTIILTMAAPSFANMSCFEQAPNAEQGKDIGGFDKDQATQQGYADVQDPVMDLVGCVAQTAFQGPKSVLNGICGCKQAVRELCSFNTKKLKISASGGASVGLCAVFAPWAI